MSDEDEDEDGSEYNTNVDLEHDVRFVRIMDNTFIPSSLKIRAEVIPLCDDIASEDFEIAITKCKYWLEAVVSRCVVFCRGNQTAMEMLLDDEGAIRCTNMLMLTPYLPSDDHMAALFQAKLTALSDGNILFGAVRIKSDNMSGLMFEFVGDSDTYLPPAEDWLGDRAYFDQPWWNRDDASTLDIVPPKDEDLSIRPSWAYTLDFLEQTIRPKKVIRPEFIPTVVKDEDDDV